MVSTSVVDDAAAAAVAGVLQPWPAAGIKAVVCDIEGTTTSISFVKDVLFPYVRQHVRDHLTATWTEPETAAVVQLLRRESEADCNAKLEGAIALPAADSELGDQVDALVRLVEWQMDGDRKATPLKQLQGQIWAKAYQSAAIKGHVYDDVPAAFDAWLAAGARVCIYSSGSVAAQKLLFGHSEHGDLLPRLTGHYDTKVGAKQVAASYAAICADLALASEQVLFLTDIVGEAKAAKEAGLKAVLVDRPGNAPLSEADRAQFAVVKSLAEVVLETSSSSTAPTLKRKLEEADEADVAADSTVDGSSAAAKVPAVGSGGDDVEVRPTKVAKTESAAVDEVNSPAELPAKVDEKAPVEEAAAAVAPVVATNGVAESGAALDEDVPMEPEAPAEAEAVVAAAAVAGDAIAAEEAEIAGESAKADEFAAIETPEAVIPEAVREAVVEELTATAKPTLKVNPFVVVEEQPKAAETECEIDVDLVVAAAEKPSAVVEESMEVDEAEAVSEKIPADAEVVVAAADVPAEVADTEVVEKAPTSTVESVETSEKPIDEPIAAGVDSLPETEITNADETAEDTQGKKEETEMKESVTEEELSKDVVDEAAASTTIEPVDISDAKTIVSNDQTEAVAETVVDDVVVDDKPTEEPAATPTETVEESPPTVVVEDPIVTDIKAAKVDADEEPIVSELKPEDMIVNGGGSDEAIPAAVSEDKETADATESSQMDIPDSEVTIEDTAETIAEHTDDDPMSTTDTTKAEETEATKVTEATVDPVDINTEPIDTESVMDVADTDDLKVETTVAEPEHNAVPIESNSTMDTTEPTKSEPTTTIPSANTNGTAAVAVDATSGVDNTESMPAQQEPVLANELNTSSTTTTTETTEVNTSEEAKEKVSRVEITIEQIEKEPTGQTKQTTTHIVKEICIKEQLVLGASSNKTSPATAEAAETPANEKIVTVELEKKQNGAEEVPAVVETSNGSGETAEENGELKNGAVATVAGELSAKTDTMVTEEEVAETNAETETMTTKAATEAQVEDVDQNNSGNDSDKENDVSSTKNGNNGTVPEVAELAAATMVADETPATAATNNKPAKCLDQVVVAAATEPGVVVTASSATEVMTA